MQNVYFSKMHFKILCVWMFYLQVRVCTTCVPSACRDQRTMEDPLVLTFGIVLNLHVCWVFCKGSEWSHLPSPDLLAISTFLSQ